MDVGHFQRQWFLEVRATALMDGRGKRRVRGCTQSLPRLLMAAYSTQASPGVSQNWQWGRASTTYFLEKLLVPIHYSFLFHNTLLLIPVEKPSHLGYFGTGEAAWTIYRRYR